MMALGASAYQCCQAESAEIGTRTLANLTHLPDAKVEALRRVLRGGTGIAGAEPVVIERALPHGHVAAVAGCAAVDRPRPAAAAAAGAAGEAGAGLIVARVIEPAAKLSTARRLSEATAAHSLGAVLVLYYVMSSYLEGRCCRFAQVYPAGLADDPLAGENPMALKVYAFIAEHCDHLNALVCPPDVLAEEFGVNERTVRRAMRWLEDRHHLVIAKIGTANAYILNPAGPGGLAGRLLFRKQVALALEHVR